MKRYLLLMFTALIAVYGYLCYDLAVSSDQVPSPPILTALSLKSDSSFAPITVAERGYGYSQLSEAQQTNYDALVQALYVKSGLDTTVDGHPGFRHQLDPYLDTETEVHELFEAVYNDHPEFFYLVYNYTFTQLGGRFNSISLKYSMDKEERMTAAAALESAVGTIVDACTATGDYETELYIHDYLLEHCVYNTAAALENADDDVYEDNCSPYNALCEGEAVCVGYTRAMQLLLNRVGIPNTAVSTTEHMWVMVWIDGEPYHVDPTWNDDTDRPVDHSYFNLTDAEIAATRDMEDPILPLPVATATQANYYRKSGYYFDNIYSGAMTHSVLDQMRSRDGIIELRFSEDVFADALEYIQNGYIFDDFARILEQASSDSKHLYDRWYRHCMYYYDDAMCTITLMPD